MGRTRHKTSGISLLVGEFKLNREVRSIALGSELLSMSTSSQHKHLSEISGILQIRDYSSVTIHDTEMVSGENKKRLCSCVWAVTVIDGLLSIGCYAWKLSPSSQVVKAACFLAFLLFCSFFTSLNLALWLLFWPLTDYSTAWAWESCWRGTIICGECLTYLTTSLWKP